MRFKTRLSFVIIPLVMIPPVLAGILLFMMTTRSLQGLYFSVLRLEMNALVQEATTESEILERLGIADSPFYAKSAREKVLDYARSRTGPSGSFLVIDAEQHVLAGPAAFPVSVAGLRVRAKGGIGDLDLVDLSTPDRTWVGYQKAFPPWSWTLYAILPARAPAGSAAAVTGPGLAVLAIGAMAAGLASRRLARSISRPIEQLAEATRRMGEGDLGARALPQGDEELASLALSFNDMASRLSGMTSDLEGQVAKRTEELFATNVELSTALERLGEAQERLVRTEKLAALGQLSAGVAHELNTPLGAIASSGQTVSDILDKRFVPVVRLSASMEPALLETFLTLVSLSLEAAAGPLAVSDRAASRKATRELKAHFESMGIAEAESLSVLVEEAGLLGKADLVDSLIGSAGEPQGLEILEATADLVSARRMLQVIGQASGQAAQVVGALRGYLHSGEKDATEEVDIGAGLEAVLALLYHRTKRGVTIDKRLAPGLIVLANANRLGQVWLNIINNALQAMEYKGRLLVEAAREGDRIRVSISDSGPGIPDHVRPRIFDSFFTTKRHGEGIGLGLDICKKIVERYGGRIGFESEPGRTVFSVSLPAAG